jgi:hypothetical protein
MVDPGRFASEVARAWTVEGIATSCISMGSDWNVDLLNRLAACGGGTIHFIDSVARAKQVLHEAYHMRVGMVAANLHVHVKVQGAACVTEVQGAPSLLEAGGAASYHLANHLRTNVEEELILRVEFPAPRKGEAVELLTCFITYETGTGEKRRSPQKSLRIVGDEESNRPGQSMVHQGVLCSSHAAMSRHWFKESLREYLRGDAQMGTAMLERSHFALHSGPMPRAYKAHMGMHDAKINDLMRFQGRVPPEYIKQRYIDELSHKDVVWASLLLLIDHVRHDASDRRFPDVRNAFSWAAEWVEHRPDVLPVRSQGAEAPMPRKYEDARPREWGDEVSAFWLRVAASENTPREEASDAVRRSTDRPQTPPLRGARLIRALSAGACSGFERHYQGTREELMTLLTSYLQHTTPQDEDRESAERDRLR